MTTPITGETWGDEIEPVKAHLQQQSAESLVALRTKLNAAREEILASVQGVTTEQAQFRPGSGEGEDAWGIAEVLRHIASVESIMADRVRQLGLGQPLALQPTYPGYMESIETRQLDELLAALSESYAELLAAIDDIEGHERLDTLDEHRRFGQMNCRGWVAMHTLHLQDHARQITRIKSMPGLPS
jgi:hypothetical protein